MKKERINVSRREFLVNSTALGTGFSLGLYVPFNSHAVDAASSQATEVNAWVVAGGL